MARHIIKIILVALLFGAALYSLVYLLAQRGDAFTFVAQSIRSSKSLESDVGKIEAVRLTPFGSYDEQTAGDNVWTTMTVEVIGAKKKVFLNIRAARKGGVWRIEKVNPPPL